MNDARAKDLPPESFGSAVDVSPGPDAEDLWWKPGWRDVLLAVGWRWVLVVPAVGVVGLIGLVFFQPRYFGMFWWFGFKGIIWALAVPVVLLADVVRRATSARKDPFCIHCGYALTGLAEQGRCPECGSGYSRQLIEEYRRYPAWFIQRHKAQKNLPRQEASLPAAVLLGVKRKRSRDGT
jgi:hypothetical protein